MTAKVTVKLDFIRYADLSAEIKHASVTLTTASSRRVDLVTAVTM